MRHESLNEIGILLNRLELVSGGLNFTSLVFNAFFQGLVSELLGHRSLSKSSNMRLEQPMRKRSFAYTLGCAGSENSNYVFTGRRDSPLINLLYYLSTYQSINENR